MWCACVKKGEKVRSVVKGAREGDRRTETTRREETRRGVKRETSRKGIRVRRTTKEEGEKKCVVYSMGREEKRREGKGVQCWGWGIQEKKKERKGKGKSSRTSRSFGMVRWTWRN